MHPPISAKNRPGYLVDEEFKVTQELAGKVTSVTLKGQQTPISPSPRTPGSSNPSASLKKTSNLNRCHIIKPILAAQ